MANVISGYPRDPKGCTRARRGAQRLSTAPSEIVDVGGGQVVIEVFTTTTQPSAGTAGRIVWLSDAARMELDDGTNWNLIGP